MGTSEPEDGLVGEWKVAPLRRTMLVLRVRDVPDPSRGGAGVLRGLDMLPAGVVGLANDYMVLSGQLVKCCACKAEDGAQCIGV